MKNLFKVLSLVALALTTFSPAFADQVEYLGKVKLAFGRDHDEVNLGDCTRHGDNHRISALKLTVHKFPANIDRLVVQYGNGSREELNVREYFRAESSSRWIDLHGGARCVEKIIVVGSAARFFNPTVKFYGLRR